MYVLSNKTNIIAFFLLTPFLLNIFFMIRHRLIQFIENKHITKYKFYQETNLSNGFLDKKGAIGSDKCEKICSVYPELNLTWLITGIGEMLNKKDNIQINKIENFNSIKALPLIEANDITNFFLNNELSQNISSSKKYYIPKFHEADFLIRTNQSILCPISNNCEKCDVTACKKLTTWSFFQPEKIYVLYTTQGIIINRLKKNYDKDNFIEINKLNNSFKIHKDEILGAAIVIGGLWTE